ncbi:MAG: hypothetical protein ACR2KQ_08095 [Actinomycetota bacterium]
MRKYPWDTWRIVMLAGALIQLGVSVLRMRGTGAGETWLSVASWLGYGLLAAGFVLAMRKRSELKEQRRERELGEAKTGPKSSG